jgi:hypothetical protein
MVNFFASMGITVKPDFLGKLVNWDFVAQNFAAA